MNFSGILLGIMSLFIIGIWHPIVIKSEYYFGKRKSSVCFLIIGIICVAASLFIRSMFLSAALALFGFSGFWGIKEVFEQEERVKKGWFPANPSRVNDLNS